MVEYVVHIDIIIERSFVVNSDLAHKGSVTCFRTRIFFCNKVVQLNRKWQLIDFGTVAQRKV